MKTRTGAACAVVHDSSNNKGNRVRISGLSGAGRRPATS